ncbi:MAG: hypothetical protein LBT22_00140 [Peptococcaceae bacterium]|jgi:hypothetical protein|nr:hypothetical protein [Peptococcaceae bacterium]
MMMKIKKTLKQTALFSLCAALLAVAVGCGAGKSLDVVGNASVTSISAVFDALPAEITVDEATGAWALSAPDNSARFLWAPDYSVSGMHDIMLEYALQPFLEAGLDVGQLPEMFTILGDQTVMIGTKLGDDRITYDGAPTPIASYEKLVELYRDTVGYHAALDHHNVSVGDGNLFEWADDLRTNDKDIVFALNPEPLIAAGVDPEKVEGWAYTTVPIDVNGKSVDVYKFLKPFDLR